MKSIFCIDNIDDVEIEKNSEAVTIALTDEDTGNRYVLEVPFGQTLQYLAEKLMFHYLFQEQIYEQLEQECEF